MNSHRVFGSLLVLVLVGCGRRGVESQQSDADHPRQQQSEPHLGPPTTIAKPHFYDRVNVLCIGINEYNYLAAPLNQAEADARMFGETLKNEFGYESHYLLSRNATKHEIVRQLEDLGNTLVVDEALSVFFAGHGTAFARMHRRGNIPVPT